jgi:hypothetical protein
MSDYVPIAEHGLVGDLRTVALVDTGVDRRLAVPTRLTSGTGTGRSAATTAPRVTTGSQ